MDSLTHIALGACMGDAFAGRKVGKKAMIWGALAQSIPDIDFVAAFWQNTSQNLLTHRGITHSILFCLLATFVMAYLAEKWHRPHNISFRRWAWFFGSVILMHIFLDAFNNYGVGWFEPFTNYRVTFNVIYVADPFFSIIPFIAFIALLILRPFSKKRKFWWTIGLSVSLAYLGYCVINKAIINKEVKELLAKQHIQYKRYFTTPAPLQSWLWFVTAQTDSGFFIGYRSMFDNSPTIPLRYLPQHKELLALAPDPAEARRLIQFSQGYFTLEKNNDTLTINDLRFGQILGWEYPTEKLVFYYYLAPAIDNKMVVQRGRFAKWDMRSTLLFWERVKGDNTYLLKRGRQQPGHPLK